MEQAILSVIELGWCVKEELNFCEVRRWFYPDIVDCRSTILNLSASCGGMLDILTPLREEYLGRKYWALVDEHHYRSMEEVDYPSPESSGGYELDSD